jgi:hypothetical protein
MPFWRKRRFFFLGTLYWTGTAQTPRAIMVHAVNIVPLPFKNN